VKMSKLGAGVIGLRMGRSHLEAYRAHPDVEVRAVCDLDEGRLREVAKTYGVPFATTDYRKLLERDDVDVVSVATPDHFHYEMASEALRKGKHVLCEKPMVTTVKEAEALVEEARRSGRKFMVGQVCRYAPGFRMAKHLIERGEIGKLFFVESEYAHDYSRVPGVGGWRKDPARPREPFLGGGCHPVDLLRWIAGDPYEVFAYANHKVLVDWPVDDCTIAIFKFPEDVLGKVLVSIGCKRPYTMRSVFWGDKGTIIADNTSPYIQIYREDFKVGQGGPEFARIPVDTASHNVRKEVEELVGAILEDRPVETDVVEGAKTVVACLAAVDSTRKGRPVRIEYRF